MRVGTLLNATVSILVSTSFSLAAIISIKRRATRGLLSSRCSTSDRLMTHRVHSSAASANVSCMPWATSDISPNTVPALSVEVTSFLPSGLIRYRLTRPRLRIKSTSPVSPGV